MASPMITWEAMKTGQALVERLFKKEVAPEDLQRFIDEPLLIQRLIAFLKAGAPEWQSVPTDSKVFSAKRTGLLLGVDTPDSPAPRSARPDEWIVYLPKCITSPKALRGTKAPMHNQDWYDGRDYSSKPGYWAVVLPVPNSHKKSQELQNRQIKDDFLGYQRTPMLVDTLLLSLGLLTNGGDFLKGDVVRCPEEGLSSDRRVELGVYDGRVRVSGGWDDGPHGSVWSSAARWISD